MRELKAEVLHKAVLTATAAGVEVDLKDSIHVGGREVKAILTTIPTGADTDEFVDYKMQESLTTVDSDFGDISGATFTQVGGEDTPDPEEIHFVPTKRYVRSYATLTGTTPSFALAAHMIVVRRSYPDE
jgi:hypothetical protein